MVEVLQESDTSLNETSSRMSEQDARRLLAICTELVSLCSKVTGRIDPAVAEILRYAGGDPPTDRRA